MVHINEGLSLLRIPICPIKKKIQLRTTSESSKLKLWFDFNAIHLILIYMYLILTTWHDTFLAGNISRSTGYFL